ncbi:MAG: Slp family lipoprotein, partial [Limisphaerales bacterium]
LRDNEKPAVEGPYFGRFIAVSPEFLDPDMFPENGLITVAGQLDGVRTELLNNAPYPYPVLQMEDTHVWPPEEYPYATYYSGPSYAPYWDWGWGWGWGLGWWPGWYGGYYYPYYYHGYHGGYHGSFHGGFHGGYHGSGGGYHGGGGGGSSSHGGGGGGGSFHGGGGSGGPGHGR